MDRVSLPAALGPEVAPPAPLAFAEGWATFVKTLSFYPSTNDRVKQSLQDVVSAFDRALAAMPANTSEWLRLRVFDGQVQIGHEVMEARAGSNLEWLEERLEKTLLSGLDFYRPLNTDGMVSFARQLLDHYTRKQLDLTFDELWRDEFPQLVLLPLRFEGFFGEGEENGSVGVQDILPVTEGGRTPDHSLDSKQSEELEARLLANQEVAARLERLRQAISAESDMQTVRVDLIGRILSQLPAECWTDFDQVLQTVIDVLAGLEARFDRGQKLADIDDVELSRLMMASSRKLFGRIDIQRPKTVEGESQEDSEPSEPKPPPKGGHKSDELILDDLEAFMQEVSELPAPDTALCLGEMEIPSEQVNVYLEYLAHCNDPQATAVELEPLVQLLAQGGQAELQMFSVHLQAALAAQVEGNPDRWERLKGFLRARHLTHLLREVGYLTVERVVEGFPQDFGIFMHSLDWTNSDELTLVESVCQQLGSKRLLDAVALTWVDQEFFQWGLPQSILQFGLRGVAPLARVIHRERGDEFKYEILAYVRRNAPDDRATCLLSLGDGALEFSWEYLDELLERMSQPVGTVLNISATMRAYIGRELRAFLRMMDDQPQALSQRLHALRLLGNFDSEESRNYLTALLKRRRLPFVPSEPKEVRKAAAQILQRWHGGLGRV